MVLESRADGAILVGGFSSVIIGSTRRSCFFVVIAPLRQELGKLDDAVHVLLCYDVHASFCDRGEGIPYVEDFDLGIAEERAATSGCGFS